LKLLAPTLLTKLDKNLQQPAASRAIEKHVPVADSTKPASRSIPHPATALTIAE
jgi:hypothetical protein